MAATAPTQGDEEAEGVVVDRVLTVPNAITAVRLALVPVFLYLLLGVEERAAAAWLLAFVGATDWVDGYLARRWHQVSTVGKVLDPVADRAVLLTGVVAILIDGSAPLWVGIVALAREGVISIGTLVVAAFAKGAKRLDVTWWGKAGTFGLFFAFPMFLASRADLGAPDVWRTLAWACALPGLVFGWVATGIYIPQAVAALRGAGPHADTHTEERTT